MNFRLIIQPAVALFFAIRAGLRDARSGRPPFLWLVFSNAGRRRKLLLQGWKDVGTVFILALVLDSIYQVTVHSGIYALELLITATILSLIPYVTVRGLVTRLASSAVTPHGGQPGKKPKERNKDQRRERKED